MTLSIALAILATPAGAMAQPWRALPVTRGWHLDGAGPARYGWAWTHPTGRVTYLGATWAAVRDAAEDAAWHYRAGRQDRAEQEAL